MKSLTESINESLNIVNNKQPYSKTFLRQLIKEPIWTKKEEPTEMTLEQICEALGKNIKIVKEIK